MFSIETIEDKSSLNDIGIFILEESKKYAYLLGYNYESSEWYENSYKLFNKKYKLRSEIEKDR